MDSPLLKSDSLKLASPNQVLLAAILGGPVAGCLFLGLNFKAMGELQQLRQTVIFGAVGIVILFGVLFFLPKFLPEVHGSLPAIVVAVTFRGLAKQFQEQAYLAHIAAGGLKTSWWKVIGLSLLCLFASLAVILVLGLSLQSVFPGVLGEA